MKFLPKAQHHDTHYSNNQTLENFIYNTKEKIASQFEKIFTKKHHKRTNKIYQQIKNYPTLLLNQQTKTSD